MDIAHEILGLMNGYGLPRGVAVLPFFPDYLDYNTERIRLNASFCYVDENGEPEVERDPESGMKCYRLIPGYEDEHELAVRQLDRKHRVAINRRKEQVISLLN